MKHIDKEKIRDWLKEILLYAVFFLIAAIILTKVLLIGTVSSGSMEPTLKVGNKVLVNGLAYTMEEPKRGDIILFEFESLQAVFTKRVIGLPGEKISFQKGEVYINDELLHEDYLREDIDTLSLQSFVIPENCYFVMGDNREESLDSRFWREPYVAKESIKGKVFLQIPLIHIKEEPDEDFDKK